MISQTVSKTDKIRDLNDSFRRTNSTPAIKVVPTAPIPGVRTPSFPFGGATLTGLRIQNPPWFVDEVMRSEEKP